MQRIPHSSRLGEGSEKDSTSNAMAPRETTRDLGVQRHKHLLMALTEACDPTARAWISPVRSCSAQNAVYCKNVRRIHRHAAAQVPLLLVYMLSHARRPSRASVMGSLTRDLSPVRIAWVVLPLVSYRKCCQTRARHMMHAETSVQVGQCQKEQKTRTSATEVLSFRDQVDGQRGRSKERPERLEHLWTL